MAAASTDYFLKATANFATTIGSGGVTDGSAATIPLTSVSGLATDTGVELTINRIDSDGAETNNYETVRGVVSGTNLITTARGVEGTAQAWAAGKIVEQLHTADIQNRMATGILVGHGQDGSHAAGLTLTTPTLTTPTISATGFTNANHAHAAANSGGQTAESALTFTDITTNNVTTSKHGFVPKAPNNTTTFLRGDATWAAPSTTATGSIIASGIDIGPSADADSTSASFTDQTGLTLNLALGASTGTIVAWLGQQVSTTNTDTQVAVRIVIGASNGSDSYAKPGVVSTAGEGISAFHLATGQTGTVTVKAQISRQSGSGTARAFGSHGHLMAIAIQE